ncbi:MAG TPA: hypothetical protein PK413_06060 [Thermoanaerobaculia bacterium]|nr:hypothetical protein [Thermoanaerobaculia bacterium]
MMATLRVPVESGSRGIREGSLPQLVQGFLEKARPESAYFYVENGRRTMRVVFDLAKSNDMMPYFEPFLMGLDAELEITPVMNAEELAAGFQAMG